MMASVEFVNWGALRDRIREGHISVMDSAMKAVAGFPTLVLTREEMFLRGVLHGDALLALNEAADRLEALDG